MDGFTGKAKPGQVRIVIAATNRPWTLDSAVLRGGRFDTQIYVPMPDTPAREQLVRLALGKDPRVKGRVDIPCAPDVTVEWLASRFAGYAGADIKSICRQASSLPMKREIIALGKGTPRDDMITRDDFETIFARYINSTSDEDLMEFDAYRLNMPLDRNYIDYKLNQIILDLYNDEPIERFEARMLKDAMETEAFKEKFGTKYDLSFLPAKLRKELGE
jgi:SpoVK/Ycf46/Vps4 family AAA+-type ATPase